MKHSQLNHRLKSRDDVKVPVLKDYSSYWGFERISKKLGCCVTEIKHKLGSLLSPVFEIDRFIFTALSNTSSVAVCSFLGWPDEPKNNFSKECEQNNCWSHLQ